MASGAREIAAPAMSAAWSTPLLLEKRVSAEGRVRWLMSLVTTRGQAGLPQFVGIFGVCGGYLAWSGA